MMKNELLIIICLILFVIGTTGIFYGVDIAEKLKTKKKTSFIRVSKAVGLIIACIALIGIYVLGR